MILALLALIVAQAGTQNSGAVTGIVRSAAGVPAAGVRVYAQQVRDAADANSPTAPLEGQTQTDAAGRYRLELPAGRYYIGSGAVSSPTYYPGTTNLSEARTVLVTAGGLIGGIDFGSFVPATSTPSFVILGVTTASISATLSGTVRYSDGAPAAGVRVFAVPSSNAPATAQTAFAIPVSPSGLTGPMGEYRILSPADTYYIVAGFAEASSFHTGDPTATTPKSVTVTASAKVDNLDVQISRPPLPPKGTAVRGRVRTADGNPVFDSTVFIARPLTPSGPFGVSLPSAYAAKETHSTVDGTFEFTDVVPGFYNARASSGPVHGYQSLEVANGPIADLEFTLPLVSLGGRILTEDGTPFTNSAVFPGLSLTNIGRPNVFAPRILPISSTGTFTISLEAGDYQLHFQSVLVGNVSEGYEIRSVKAGNVDLAGGKVHIDGRTPITLEVRIARSAATTEQSSK